MEIKLDKIQTWMRDKPWPVYCLLGALALAVLGISRIPALLAIIWLVYWLGQRPGSPGDR